jgi:hypothetical protein
MSNAERRRLRELKSYAKEHGTSRKMMPIKTPLGVFPNAYSASQAHKEMLFTFWHKVMDPSNPDYTILDGLPDHG